MKFARGVVNVDAFMDSIISRTYFEIVFPVRGVSVELIFFRVNSEIIQTRLLNITDRKDRNETELEKYIKLETVSFDNSFKCK